MITKAMFTSVWDDCIEINSYCKVNTETKEVFDIEGVDAEEYDVNSCTEEYITFPDGYEYSVYHRDDADDGDYWYV